LSDRNTPPKKPRAENLLFRSRLEICRILQLLSHEHSPITAEIKGHPFSAHALAVDRVAGYFFITYSPHKLINAILLESPKVEFTATDKMGLHFTFEASHPEDTQHSGTPAIRFDLPTTLLLHNRREHPRIPVGPEISLRCVADAEGFIPFESHITDISHEGLGCLLYDPDIHLEPGAILKGCRIISPNGDAVIADLELLNTAQTATVDGAPALRAGFHFVQKTVELKKLLDIFIQNLDKQ
jgi:c-di-GMP-binding flagellar brake protein YcgR